MKFAESFKALGYELRSPRSDWSAEKPDCVCISIWEKEVQPLKAGGSSFDVRTDAQPISGWQHKAGNKKRIKQASNMEPEWDIWPTQSQWIG